VIEIPVANCRRRLSIIGEHGIGQGSASCSFTVQTGIAIEFGLLEKRLSGEVAGCIRVLTLIGTLHSRSMVKGSSPNERLPVLFMRKFDRRRRVRRPPLFGEDR
jgi:hypothetical protein